MTTARKTPQGFYVYVYLRASDSRDGNWPAGSPYYVGKGTGRRAWKRRGDDIARPKDPNNIVIVAEGLESEDAFTLEAQLTHRLGRINKGTGCLRNRTDGGLGGNGAIKSEAARAKCRESKLGKNNPMYGKPGFNRGKLFPPEWRHKLSLAHKGPRPGRVGSKLTGSSSSYQGVGWHKRGSTWSASIWLQGKLRHIGYSPVEIVAAQMYDAFVIKHELNRPLNFPHQKVVSQQLLLVWG